jgi:hypothetical protein
VCKIHELRRQDVDRCRLSSYYSRDRHAPGVESSPLPPAKSRFISSDRAPSVARVKRPPCVTGAATQRPSRGATRHRFRSPATMINSANMSRANCVRQEPANGLGADDLRPENERETGVGIRQSRPETVSGRTTNMSTCRDRGDASPESTRVHGMDMACTRKQRIKVCAAQAARTFMIAS